MKTTGLKGSEVLSLIEQNKIATCCRTGMQAYNKNNFNKISFAQDITDTWSVTYKPIVITLEDVEAVYNKINGSKTFTFNDSTFKEMLIEKCTK